MQTHFCLQNPIVITNNFNGEDFRIIIEVPQNIIAEEDKINFIKEILKELRTLSLERGDE